MKSFFKKILALGVSLVILMFASVLFQLAKAVIDNGMGQNVYDSYGTIGTFGLTLVSFLPLIVGIWLIKITWKIITKENNHV